MFSALMGCFTVPGLGNPLVLHAMGTASVRGQFLGLSIPAHFPDSPSCFLGGGSVSCPSRGARTGTGSGRARAGGMECADSCGTCKMVNVALPGVRRASKAGVWLSLPAKVIL